jgi:hypothetical protein
MTAPADRGRRSPGRALKSTLAAPGRCTWSVESCISRWTPGCGSGRRYTVGDALEEWLTHGVDGLSERTVTGTRS